MKKIILILLITFSICAAQPNDNFAKFFDSTFPALKNLVQIVEHTNGYYLVTNGLFNLPTGGSINRESITKIDWYGKVLWSTNLNLFTKDANISPAVLLPNDGLLVSGTSDDSPQPYYSKLNSDGEIEWTLELDRYKDGVGVAILNDGNFMGILQDANTELALAKISGDGELLWTKPIYSGNSGKESAQIYRLSDSTLVVRSSAKVWVINHEGQVKWTYNSPWKIISMIVDHNNHIVLYGYTDAKINDAPGAVKLNDKGEIIWERVGWNYSEGGNNSLGLTIEDNYLLICENVIEEYDQDGYQISEYVLPIGIKLSLKGSNNKIILGGSSQIQFPFFARTDGTYFFEDILFYRIEFTYPINPKSLLFRWFSYNINYIDIDYSTNNLDWENIVEAYPAKDSPYEWEFPRDNVVDTLYIRLSKSGDPNIYKTLRFPLKTALGYYHYEYIAANEVFMWVGNIGDGSHDPRTDGSGFYWPGGEEAEIAAIYQDGLVYGGKLNGEIRVNGNTHRAGLVPGIILENGEPDDPYQKKYNVFKFKKNWHTVPPGEEREKYIYNIENWPVEIGAPFIDKNENGEYDEYFDIPGNGADEFLYYVANGADSSSSAFTYGSLPLKLEFQTSVYAYNNISEIDDVVFKKYLIINKGDEAITDFYVSYWSDDDMGDAADDYIGVDSTLGLVYTYNKNEEDYFYGSPPPAVGHMLLQGPIVESILTDSAYYMDEWIQGYKNLKMTSAINLLKNYFHPDYILNDPQQGVYEGTLEFYYLMQGKDLLGRDILDPITGAPVNFMVPGDPEKGSGWYEGEGWPEGPGAGDRRNLLSSGPFDFAPQDTQEVVIAIFMARGTDRKNSVTELKNTAVKIREFYYGEHITNLSEDLISPDVFELKQNYPNPFNPTTTIEYTIPQIVNNQSLSVKLIIYDILGREAATLVNETQSPGNYKVNFDASKLSSGVYLYSLKAGEFMQTRKMILLR